MSMDIKFDATNPDGREALYDAISQGNEYFTYTANGLSFIGYSTDKYIIRYSYITNTIWAYSSIQLFYDLVHRYYNVDDSQQKYFFDVGANIGTTGISFCKNFDQNTKLVAFEPVKDNFRMLSINALLNDLPSGSYDFVNEALGSKAAQAKVAFANTNTGGSSITYLEGTSDSQDNLIETDTLDNYVEKHSINPEEIKYLWIDTEGFEPEVLKGAEKTLSSADIPIFMEFTPHYYKTRLNVELADFVEYSRRRRFHGKSRGIFSSRLCKRQALIDRSGRHCRLARC